MKNLSNIIKYLVITTIIAFAVILIVRGVLTSSNERKLSKLYGDDYCEYNGNHPVEIDYTALYNDRHCHLCNKPAPSSELCHECAEKVHRCYKCGKKIK